MKPQISILYVYYNTPEEIRTSILSIKKAVQGLSYEVIIVNNNSRIPIPGDIINRYKIKVIQNLENLGYGKAINLGAKVASGKYLLIANTDVVFLKDSIYSIFKKLSSTSKIGIIGPGILNTQKKPTLSVHGPLTPLHAVCSFSFLYKLFPNNTYASDYWMKKMNSTKEQDVEAVSGACMAIRRSLFYKIKGFDERFFLYFEESDICKRIKQAGYNILYYPSSQIIHYIGRSSGNSNIIRKHFEKSRFEFLKKHHGTIPAFIAEFFIRAFTFTNITILFLITLSSFLNLYRINNLMLFIGDIGRDYLASRDFVLSKQIPLVGIPSSVSWLHQGPLSIYLITIGFILGRFNPVAPAILYGILGIVSTILVFKIGKEFFNKYVGLISGAFFATSPLVVVNARMPYHTSSIPFFSLLFFYFLYKSIQRKKVELVTFLFLGLLLQTELSNAVLIPVALLVLVLYKITFKKSEILKAFLFFLLGILPFVIYDIKHNFVQTGGLVLWILNRVRLFFGLSFTKNTLSFHTSEALQRLYQQLCGIIFPSSIYVVFFICLLCFLVLIRRKGIISKFHSQKELVLVLLWICIPILGFIVHTAPGTAYFPVIFPAVSFLIGYAFYNLVKWWQPFVVVIFSICFINAFSLVHNEFYLNNLKAQHNLPPFSYNLGYGIEVQENIAVFIVQNAQGKKFTLKGGGFINTLVTGIDNYTYLSWYKGGNIEKNSNLIYTIFEDKKAIPRNKKVIYENKYIAVTKDED